MLAVEWLGRTIILGGLIGIAALALEQVVRRGTRFVWVGALLLSILLPLSSLAPGLWPESLKRTVDETSLVSWDGPATGSTIATTVVSAPQQRVSAPAIARMVWLLLSVAIVLRWLHGWLQLRAARRRCGERTLSGARVLVSDGLGPAVIGLLRPRIVIPARLLNGDVAVQRMIVCHEAEHIRARDQWLLGLAPFLTVLFPWNAALWWQIRRMRTAIELDCDARVLRRGVAPIDYGSMLLDVAGGTRSTHPMLATLSEPHTSLERRIRAMTPKRHRHGIARAASFLTLSMFSLAAAVFAGAPTAMAATAQEPPKLIKPAPRPVVPPTPPAVVAPNKSALPMPGQAPAVTPPPKAPVPVDAPAPPKLLRSKPNTPPSVHPPAKPGFPAPPAITPDSPSPGKTASPAPPASPSVPKAMSMPNRMQEGSPLLVLDGKVFPPTTKLNLDDNSIRSVELLTPAEAIKLYGSAGRFGAVVLTSGGKTAETAPTRQVYVWPGSGKISMASGGARPLFLVDGVVVNEDIATRLDNDDIDSVEIVKGAEAARLYGERGANGVVSIRTKK